MCTMNEHIPRSPWGYYLFIGQLKSPEKQNTKINISYYIGQLIYAANDFRRLFINYHNYNTLYNILQHLFFALKSIHIGNCVIYMYDGFSQLQRKSLESL